MLPLQTRDGEWEYYPLVALQRATIRCESCGYQGHMASSCYTTCATDLRELIVRDLVMGNRARYNAQDWHPMANKLRNFYNTGPLVRV